MKNIWDSATEAALAAGISSAYTIRAIAQAAILRFIDLSKGRRTADDSTKLSLITEMYQQIWVDPSKDAVRTRWAGIKKTTVDQGPPSGPDLVILSTAAKHQDVARTEILTCDHDFLLFEKEIRDTFAVEIRSVYKLPKVARKKP
jgi:hypothetical protein